MRESSPGVKDGCIESAGKRSLSVGTESEGHDAFLGLGAYVFPQLVPIILSAALNPLHNNPRNPKPSYRTTIRLPWYRIEEASIVREESNRRKGAQGLTHVSPFS